MREKVEEEEKGVGDKWGRGEEEERLAGFAGNPIHSDGKREENKCDNCCCSRLPPSLPSYDLAYKKGHHPTLQEEATTKQQPGEMGSVYRTYSRL